MNIEKVLIAVDDLVFGAAITEFITHHNWTPGSMLLVLHVVQPIPPSPPFFIEQSEEEETRQGQDLVTKISADIKAVLQQTCSVDTRVEWGIPKETILKVASDWKATMIIMGSHGRHGLDRFLMGSVSLSIVSHAHCSVTVIRLSKARSERIEL